MSSFISSPYKTPTKSRNKSDLSLSDLSTPSRYSGVDSKHDQILDKIYETKEDIKILSAKTDAYAKNSSLIYSNYSTPKKPEGNEDRYKKSPYGKQLGISDCSPYV